MGKIRLDSSADDPLAESIMSQLHEISLLSERFNTSGSQEQGLFGPAEGQEHKRKENEDLPLSLPSSRPRPANLKKGTRTAHVIASAAIKELLLGDEKADLSNGRGANDIFNIKFPLREDEMISKEEREDLDSVVSFLTANSRGTKTRIFKELSLDFAGGDNISVISDDVGESVRTTTALSFKQSFTKAVYNFPSRISAATVTESATPGEMVMKRSFRRWRFLVRSRVLARFSLHALRRHSQSMNKSKTVAFKIWLLYNKHLKSAALGGFKRWREYRRWTEAASLHVQDVRNLRMKRESLRLWSLQYSQNTMDRRKMKVLSLWSQNSLKRCFRRWKISAVVTTGWMLHLTIRKWSRITRISLVERGRIRGRRNRRIKVNVLKILTAYAVHRKELKLKTVACLENFKKTLLDMAWSQLRTMCKALAVKEMVDRRKMISFLNFLSVRLSLKMVRNRYTVMRGFTWWKRAANISLVAKRVVECYEMWIVGDVFDEWRDWFVGEKEVFRFRERIAKRKKERVLFTLVSLAHKERGIRKITKMVECRFVGGCWKAWRRKIEDIKKDRRNELMAESWWKEKGRLRALFKVLDNCRKRKGARNSVKRGVEWRLRRQKRRGFEDFAAISRRTGQMRVVERKALHVAIRWKMEKDKHNAIHKLERKTDLAIRSRKSMKFASGWWVTGRLEVGVTCFFRTWRMGKMRRRRERKMKRAVVEHLVAEGKKRKQERAITNIIALKVEKERQKECWKRWRKMLEAKKCERKLLVRAEKFWVEKMTHQFLRKWAVRSLRKAAGYQIADRFRARRALGIWRGLAEGWREERIATWRGDRWREVRGLELGWSALRNLKERRRWAKEALDLWRGLGRRKLSTSWVCFQKWIVYRKLQANLSEQLRCLHKRKRRKQMMVGFLGIKDAAAVWERVIVIFAIWRESASMDEDGVVKASNFSRKLRKQRALRLWQEELKKARKLEEAEKIWKLRTLKVCVAKMKEFKNAQLRVPILQGERKRVVLRKMKITVLKLQLSRAHWARNLVRKCFTCWRQYDILLAQNAGNFRKRNLMALGFRRLAVGEKLGRRGRWIGKLVGGRREISGGYAQRFKEQQGGAGGGIFSPGVSRKRGYSK